MTGAILAWHSLFNLLIGGLRLHVAAALAVGELPQPVACMKAFVEQPHASAADLQICMEWTSYIPEDLGPVLLAGPHFRFHASSQGVVLLRFYFQGQELPHISIQSDEHFSTFHCRIHSQASPDSSIVDPCLTAADAFLLQHSFIHHKGIILHAGGGSVYGRGMVFAGPSGAGKSTLCHLLAAAGRNCLFSDERVIVRPSSGGWNVWGTPWQGSGNIVRNESTTLAALVFLQKSEQTKIVQLSPTDSLRRLLQVASIPWYSEEWTHKGLVASETLLRIIPAFELSFRPDQSAVQAVEQLAASLT